jgi:ribosome-associated protein
MPKAFRIRGEFIELAQLLKAVGAAETGAEAKAMVQAGEVELNDETEIRRSKKVFPGDVVTWPGGSVRVEGES